MSPEDFSESLVGLRRNVSYFSFDFVFLDVRIIMDFRDRDQGITQNVRLLDRDAIDDPSDCVLIGNAADVCVMRA